MMVFGKQSTPDIADKPNNVTTRSYHLSINERKSEDSSNNQEYSSSTISKLLPIQPENVPLSIMARYDSTTLNRPQTTV
jgi:hypothetical protein